MKLTNHAGILGLSGNSGSSNSFAAGLARLLHSHPLLFLTGLFRTDPATCHGCNDWAISADGVDGANEFPIADAERVTSD